ncbi:hypothetical protein MLD38_021791 [Melastoma candidum]|uniref:Uncharacterized protein n=1 Tax=Melastoma candidum TaxID=119954 RepID=A0ACB9QHP2_9MYRT|nr:hypothetical protein MLD38_021791 [Melastoma candidum]
MVRISNAVTGFMNILSAIGGLLALGAGFYLNAHQTSSCQEFLKVPLLVIGGTLFLVSLIGLIGSCARINFFLYIFLTLMFLLILGMIGITIFVFAVTNEGAGKVVSGTGYKEYRLGDYSDWLQNHLAKGKTWDQIRTCMIDAKACQKLAAVPANAEQFFKMNLTPIESGCCKPPTSCGLEFKNATFWAVPASGPAIPDSDCTTWSNDQKKLCFDCESCKAGFLANIKSEWKMLLIINICAIVLAVAVYSIGCCAARNNKEEKRYSRYYGYA